jgi:hypothetical protein
VPQGGRRPSRPKEQADTTSEPTRKADRAPDIESEEQSPFGIKPSIFRQDLKKSVPHKSINGDRPLLRKHSIDISHNVAHKEVGTEYASSANDKEGQTGYRLNVH